MMSGNVLRELAVDGRAYRYCALDAGTFSVLPFTLRILAENLLRHAHERDVAPGMVDALARGERGFEIPFRPARVLLQDMLGTPVVVDLAGLRDAVAAAGGDPLRVNPKIPVDVVVDHSLIADVTASSDAMRRNSELEFARNRERFELFAWCQSAFSNFRVVPPNSGIVHQVNLERLARGVWTREEGGVTLAYPDTVLCNDSHTPMVNSIGVLGWGVGGIEAEAAMLGRALTLNVPEVLGVRVTGELPPGATATDLVLTATELFRNTGVVGKFIEFYGAGLERLPVTERATLANMAPEYGATCVFFPVDRQCIDYLAFTGREAHNVALVEAYSKAQGLWRDAATPQPRFDAEIELDLSKVKRCLAGPRRPQDRVDLADVARGFAAAMPTLARDGRAAPTKRVSLAGRNDTLGDGDVVIAAITSCTNTSNPANLITAGLLARNAVAHGLTSKPWVKTSLAPGSKVVMAYLERAGLVAPLEALGFHLIGFGCTTCNGNSGPLAPEIESAIKDHQLVSVAVLSGNRNFEGRVHPYARAAYLASPPLVVAYAIAGTITHDLERTPLGLTKNGKFLFLKDIVPSPEEVSHVLASALTPELYRASYANLFEGTAQWRALRSESVPALFPWRAGSTYLCRPPFFDHLPPVPPPLRDITGMRPLAILGDMVTTDHMAPAGMIATDSPAGRYLVEHGVTPAQFHGYSPRRGNHDIAVRSAFMSMRLKNDMAPGTEGGVTTLQPDGKVMAIFDAAQAYRARGEPLIIIAGREYGAGSSRDWAAKGPALLGVRAVVAESFERIHRSNLVGMGVLPLELIGRRRSDLLLDGTETFDVTGVAAGLSLRGTLTLRVHRAGGHLDEYPVLCRIETAEELSYYRHGGLLPYVYREMIADNPTSKS